MTQPTLKLTNTLTREKDIFKPLDPTHIGLYVCGVTPYDDSHIGHARAYVVFDVLYRLLKHLYPKVTYVRNFTDIADEIIKRAAEKNEEPTALAEHFIRSFYADMDALNVLRPDIEPRVSTHIPGMVEMIGQLIEKQYAYVTPSGDVMYRTAKFPRFGQLARRKLDEQQHGSRVKADDEKENPNDFVLWKANAKSATKLEQAFNPADYGAKNFSAPGRPGWHIECSVMSKQHLGPTFDIHGGGEDLQFPHHCCEIAQSEALLPPNTNMANYWLHNGFITVGGTKMSKSLGNFTTIKQALQKYSPEAIRLWLLQTHYRKPVDFSDEALQAAEARWQNYKRVGTTSAYLVDEHASANTLTVRDEIICYEAILEALRDDLNTPQALAELDKLVTLHGSLVKNHGSLQDIAFVTFIMRQAVNILGLSLSGSADFSARYRKITQTGFEEDESYELKLPAEILKLYEARAAARQNKEWEKSDRLREELKALGILVEDGPQGQTWRRL